MTKTEAELLELMRADRQVMTQRQAAQATVDAEASREHVPAVRIPRVSRRRRLPGVLELRIRPLTMDL
jgi:hypothetical protein